MSINWNYFKKFLYIKLHNYFVFIHKFIIMTLVKIELFFLLMHE